MENKRNGEDEFDDLLRQADALIGDDGQDYFHAPGGVDEESAPDGEYVGNIRNFNNNYGYQPEPAAPVIPAYNQDYREYSRNVRQAPVQQPVYREPEPPVRETPKPKKKKKKHRFLKFLLVLAILLGGLGFWLSTLFVKPETDRPIGERKKDAVTILLCGTDMEGTRTDTMMLLYICAEEKAVNLVSLPRDTLTHTTSGKNAKLNSAFGRNNGKEDPVEGMENLMLYVRDIIGYMPDGYMLINLEGFVDVPGTRCCVFYPDGGVSEAQRLQMVTTGGSNTHVIAVEGNFDDAQTGVKRNLHSRRQGYCPYKSLHRGTDCSRQAI